MSEVNVSVVNNNIVVDPPTLNMAGRGPNAQIQWNLTTPGWTFPSNGIVIDNNNGEFTQLRPIAGGSKFLGVDANNNATLYKYMINVTNGQEQLSLDPYIQNGPSK
jgi:hypothetical protein